MTDDVRAPSTSHERTRSGNARWLVFLLAFCWGFNWPVTRIALYEIPPWTVRGLGVAIGVVFLFAAAALRGTSMKVPPGRPRLHLALAGLINVAGFNLFAAFAQLNTNTSRAVIVAYTMPIWTAALAIPALRERLNPVRLASLALCAIGLSILIAPLLDHGVPFGILFALGAAWCWAIGTIYLKLVKIPAPTLAIAGWQLAIGCVFMLAGMLVFDGVPHLFSLHPRTLFSLLYSGLFGLGLAYLLWFTIIERLPALTASLGVLMVPVVGIVMSTIFLGERPSITDIVGFALIFAASALVLLRPGER